jgi:hypothetical protein
LVTAVADTGNVAELEPSGTVTVAGTVATAGDALRSITAPPPSAVEESVTVQVDPADSVRDTGLHDMPLNRGVWRIMTVPPLAEVDIPAPTELAETPFVSWTGEVESGGEFANVSVSEATTLFGIVKELRPQTKHVAVPSPLLHDRDLSASAEPIAKVADVKSVVE